MKVEVKAYGRRFGVHERVGSIKLTAESERESLCLLQLSVATQFGTLEAWSALIWAVTTRGLSSGDLLAFENLVNQSHADFKVWMESTDDATHENKEKEN